MFTLCVKDFFSAAHSLTGYHGKCEDIHGHNFQVEVFIKGQQPEDGGMVIDFTVLKRRLREVLDPLDHKFINEIPFFRERASSSEYIAVYVFRELRKLMKETAVFLVEVRVWESDTAWVAYSE
ncbi:MAG: 6-carboxy-5,6,7,8-tetrahydropterin synthase [Syntrophorhabdus sp. PtaU1.Bin153]|nr:MAG: 6-carboxy-5,6,7,8-tetrahydropterin synthase [Syntrophorhabdus sp. PtaU1.Bin153]